MKIIYHILLSLLLLIPVSGRAEAVIPKEVLSFEEGSAPAVAAKGSKLTISGEHYKFGTHSLLWQWNKKGSAIEFPGKIPYLKENPNPKETSVSSFVFWVYSTNPIDGKLRFSFMKGDKECAWFEYSLNFNGWRGAWVAFDRDMQGTPEEGMDKLVITAPKGVKKGELYFDGIITSAFEDIRHHTPDWQAPFINEKTKSHWLVLNNSWKLQLDVEQKPLEGEMQEEMRLINERFIELVTGKRTARSYKSLRKLFDGYEISRNADGSIKGKPIFFTRYGETFINLGQRNASKQWSESHQLLNQANDLLFQIALAWKNETDELLKGGYERMYLDLTEHLLDQGFAAGSAQGTLHHLGYSMRNFYTAPVIMRPVLQKAGMLEEVQQAMEWFSGVGEIKLAPKAPGMDIDAFNTSLMGRLASLLVLEDSPYKYAYIKAWSRWIDNGLKHTEGLRACFKRDGSVVHHRKSYPAYAIGGMAGAVDAVWMLAGTSLAVSQESHEVLKQSMMEMRFYCNKISFPLAMSGRHPDGKGALIPAQYHRLALAGSPDGTELIDNELAAAYLRFRNGEGQMSQQFLDAGIKAEKAPTGSRFYPYSCTLSHRQNEWLVTFAGHSRYIWASEIYNGANLFGRYLSHGSMQILSERVPDINSFSSGYQVDGYDWCHIPGTTAAVLPFKELRAEVLNVDEVSGYEEMLLSDEWFAGGLGHGKGGAVFAMKLHEHDKYNGSLRAHKSYFAYKNIVVALGSDICNAIDAEVHTTLFQNSLLDEKSTKHGIPTYYTGESSQIKDCFGNVYFIRDAEVVYESGKQDSFHEESCKPTTGYFEKAYIVHGDYIQDKEYEYMCLVKPQDKQVTECKWELPYEVLRKDEKAHSLSFKEGPTAHAVFEQGEVDGLILESTPALIIYSSDADGLNLSISNPDLALYSGPSDEVFDEQGKRKERSIYSRTWLNNPSAETYVELTLQGKWTLSQAGGNYQLKVQDGKTHIKVSCKEAMGEEAILKKL